MQRVRGRELIGRTKGRHAVARHDGHEQRARRPRREQPHDAREHRVIVAEDAAKQRSPRKVDGERRGQAVQRSGRMLGRRYCEQRVRRRAAARRPLRGFAHAGGVRVDADHERVGAA